MGCLGSEWLLNRLLEGSEFDQAARDSGPRASRGRKNALPAGAPFPSRSKVLHAMLRSALAKCIVPVLNTVRDFIRQHEFVLGVPRIC